MSKTIGLFVHATTKMVHRDSLPFNPFVVIALKHWGTEVGSGAPLVSASLASEQEIDAHVQNLKADLDAVATRAKRDLRNAIDESKKLLKNGKID